MLTFAEQRVLARPFSRIFHCKRKLLKQDERIIAVGTRKIATQKMQRLQK